MIQIRERHGSKERDEEALRRLAELGVDVEYTKLKIGWIRTVQVWRQSEGQFREMYCKPFYAKWLPGEVVISADESENWNLPAIRYEMRDAHTGVWLFGQGYCVAECLASARAWWTRGPMENRRRVLLAVNEDQRKQLDAKRESDQALMNARHRGGRDEVVQIDAPTLLSENEFATVRVSRRRREIYEKFGGRCHYCDNSLVLEGRWHVDHDIPRALGGTNDTDNLVAACAPCNHKKRDRTGDEFRAALKAIKAESK